MSSNSTRTWACDDLCMTRVTMTWWCRHDVNSYSVGWMSAIILWNRWYFSAINIATKPWWTLNYHSLPAEPAIYLPLEIPARWILADYCYSPSKKVIMLRASDFAKTIRCCSMKYDIHFHLLAFISNIHVSIEWLLHEDYMYSSHESCSPQLVPCSIHNSQ